MISCPAKPALTAKENGHRHAANAACNGGDPWNYPVVS
jgi:hypothetical protein